MVINELSSNFSLGNYIEGYKLAPGKKNYLPPPSANSKWPKNEGYQSKFAKYTPKKPINHEFLKNLTRYQNKDDQLI